MDKKIVFLMKVMLGGGAERVVTLLCNAFAEKGYDVTLVLTHQKKADAMTAQISEKVSVRFLEEETRPETSAVYSKLSRVAEIAGDADKAAILKYRARNASRIKYVENIIAEKKNCTVIAFLNDPTYLGLLTKTAKTRLVISERGDPAQFDGNKTTAAFIRRLYSTADALVCQSPDAEKWFAEHGVRNTRVIFNPVKADLPEPYFGERRKKIVNFCRISDQKNLIMLTDAFDLFSREFPDYELYVYGDAVGNGAEGYVETVNAHISGLASRDRIRILPSRRDIHAEIRDYAMFVSSSDYEGMSNSMLEAMALGMPVVCTDCPAGGARAVIENGVNGVLVPVGDAEKMSEAMKRVASDTDFARKISANAAGIKESQSVGKIISQWEEVIK